MMRLNSYQGKRLLALARGGDFAHPGETEAIDLVWSYLPKSREQAVLDAGCGRGGTAAYVQRAGWGRVTGIDIEGESINKARDVYPEISFEVCAAEHAANLGEGKFDVVYCFNSFYAFPDQAGALKALAATAAPGARLAIFDYTNPGTFNQSPLYGHVELLSWTPLAVPGIGTLLDDAGWSLETVHDVTPDYIRWYEDLVARIENLRPMLVEECGEETWAYASEFYRAMLRSIEDGHMGGAIVNAIK